MQALLTDYNLGGIKLNNRIVMAPMTRRRANNSENAPTDLHVEYYRQRSSAGLIITEGSQISTIAVGYVNTPGIYSKAQIEAWKKVTQAVHEEDGKIFIQLWHVGRISHPDFHNGELPLAPSAINPKLKLSSPKGHTETVTPKEMTIEEIKSTVRDFKSAAENAILAGFDGIEVHSSNGYLFHQFFNRCSNVRTDEYGGSIENRARFLFEVIEEIKKVIPENQIGLRFNPSLHGASGMIVDEETTPTFDYIINRLNDYKLAYIHLTETLPDVINVPYAEPHIAKRYRKIYKGTIIINRAFDRDKGNKIIEEGLADLVSFGRLFISNPDLPERFAQNAELSAWDSTTFYTSGPKGYIDYPKLPIKI